MLTLVAATAATVLVEASGAGRVAASGGSCTTGSVYSLGSAGNIYQIDTATAARTLLGTMPSNPSYNALGITSDGAHAYAATSSGTTTTQIFEFDTANATTTSFAGPAVSGSYNFVMGAVDPLNGIYYLGSPTSTGLDLYGIDTSTNTPIAGRIAQVQGLASGAAGGDFVFDASGHLYIVFSGTNNQLVRVNQAIPATPGNTQLTSTLLTNPTGASVNGVTFDGDGYLYVSSSTTLSKLNPNTGALVSSVSIPAAQNGDNTVDLADCQYNGSVQVQANVAGRYGSGDQFTVSITGGGVTSGNTGTTAGTAVGQQADPSSTAGPVVALAATTYDIHESAAGGSLANYTLAAACVDAGNGDAPVTLTPLTPGSTTDYSLVFPAAGGSGSSQVDCTFTDSPVDPPTIVFHKVLAAARVADTDQFTTQIRTGSATGPVVSTSADATTTGSGASVTSGTGTTGTFVGAAGTTYYLTEAAAGTADLSAYQASVTCTDAAGVQTGLPASAPFDGSLAVTPVNGARIDCVLSNGVERYTVAEASSPAVVLRAGTVSYSVTIANTGSVAYTASSASAAVDLTGALDDASLVAGSIVASQGSAALVANSLSWSGPLPVGAAVTVSFALVVDEAGSGDGVLASTVAATGIGGDCAGTCTTSTPVQSYTASVTAGSAVVNPGHAGEITLTVTNTGAAPYATATASVDLSGVVDDATLVGGSITASAGTASVSGSTLNWSGPLAVNAVVTVGFQVAVANPDTGDHQLTVTAAAAGPGGSCATECTAQIAVQSYALSKAADTTVISQGAVITYTVVATNTGAAPYPGSSATFSDDLGDIVDDATVVPGSITASAGAAQVTGTTLTWAGPIAVGALAVVTYQVRVADPDHGNKQLTNVVTATGPGGACMGPSDCSVQTPLASFRLGETSSPAIVLPGGVVTYAATVTNTGTYAYPAGAASFAVALAGELDDGSVVAGSITATSGSASLAGNELVWTGALPISGEVTVTYQLKLDAPDRGDHLVANNLVPTAPGGSCASATACAAYSLVQSYSVSLAQSTDIVNPGSDIAYTVTIVNTGQVAYTGSAATARVDLTAVSDDASYLLGSASASGGTVQLSNTYVSWAGALPVAAATGSSVTIHFSMHVKPATSTGDGVLTSEATAGGAGGNCAAGCALHALLQKFSATSATDTSTVVPGGLITFTVTATNTGKAAYLASAPASFTDQLGDLLDDATLVDGSIATNVGTVATTADSFTWTGPLAVAPEPGATVVVSFQIRVNDPVTGNHALVNRVVPDLAAGIVTAPGSGSAAPTAIKSFSLQPQISATGVSPGDVVAFTVLVTNTGTKAYTSADPASFRVDLGGAFIGASIDTDGTVGASYAANRLTWRGPLALRKSVTVTYTLILGRGDGSRHLLDTIVTASGSGGACGTGPTDTGCAAPLSFVSGAVLADTGVDSAAGLTAGGLALGLGCALMALALVLGSRAGRGHRRRL